MDETPIPTVAAAAREAALSRADFPLARVARRLGLSSEGAGAVLRDPERARTAVSASITAYLAADDAHRAGHPPTSAIATDPDFPTGVGMALVGAALLWDARDLIPPVALRVARDHYEDGADELAVSYIALVQESVDPGGEAEQDSLAWAAQSLLVAVLQRSGAPAQAAEIARDLVAHGIPLDLWRSEDPQAPDDSLAWHGGAFVGGIPPRRDERSLSFEDVHDYLATLLADTRREQQAEQSEQSEHAEEGRGSAGSDPEEHRPGTD